MVAKGKRKQASIVLLSGGIDSAACVHYYIDLNFEVNATFIDYGQNARDNERQSAKRIAAYYNIKLDQVSLSSTEHFGPGEIRGRNAFLIMVALLNYPQYKGIISLGIHSGTPYYDCSPQFIRDITPLTDAYTNGEVRIDVPFLTWEKPAVYTYCKEKNIPIHLTYSCEAGTNPPCGECRSCKDRELLNVL